MSRTPVFVGLLYFVLATAALELTRGADGIATIWPSSGVAVAGLLLTESRGRPYVLMAIALSSFIANYLHSLDGLFSLGLTTANVVEAIVAFAIMRGIGKRNDSFYNITAILRFCVAAVAAAISSALTATILTGGFSVAGFISWLTTVTLGILIVVPLIVNFLSAAMGPQSQLETSQWHRVLLTLACVAITGVLVFSQSTFPLLFLPVVVIVLATYLLGPTGATCSIFLIAVIGSVATWMERGPIHLMAETATLSHVQFFQFYLFSLLASCFPLAALQNMRDRQFEEIMLGNRWLEMSERLAKVGHWRLDLLTSTVFWSDEVFRIHDLEPGQMPPLDTAVGFYHPEDRPMVDACLERATTMQEGFEFEARMILAGDTLRYVYSRGDIEFAPDGSPRAIFGIFQDITERALSSRELASAKQRAETEAQRSKELAETDVLTGIANRRKTMEILDAEIMRAKTDESPLSVALLDIDHFKAINDRLGHEQGDVVIRRVAQVCATTLRGSDFVGRIGGEEFLLILPGADVDTGHIIAERVRKSIENLDWSPVDLAGVTVSIGLAAYSRTEDGKRVVRRADRALYQAKSDGRNLLRLAS